MQAISCLHELFLSSLDNFIQDTEIFLETLVSGDKSGRIIFSR